ncbi:MAG: hypothetical protein J7L08_04500 [Candidatus Aenigmarchaeota archaeon]|nr:hypothetical protein [Candidatus Aenigmarchaeota archaeon]
MAIICGEDLESDGIGGLPVGFVYIQFPKQPKPAQIFGGVWEEITPDYAGLFFRAEGGYDTNRKSDSFSETEIIVQEDALQRHRHNLKAQEDTVTNTSYDNNTITYAGTWWAGYVSDPVNCRSGNETRPINTAIRLWKKNRGLMWSKLLLE